ncbi:alpha-2-macroglobulin [Thiocapsa imhoffii]|uniref:Alpha-2-macroglobulin n=1 Tax=Thiocapsa imhoffii TaxID=382777 RepID=A0A9X0WG58_9GAMM|nr:alpha-2-macroglobulin family protein [Thiocapsa imhoffii]MBK1644003.1 alpha-2-macroglobulin [Thiocapsa imhoffii]
MMFRRGIRSAGWILLGGLGLITTAVLGADTEDPGARVMTMMPGIDYFGGDYDTLTDVDLAACRDACQADETCLAFTYNLKVGWCFLKQDFADPRPFADAVSGRVLEGTVGATNAERTASRDAELRFLPAALIEAEQRLAARIAAGPPPKQDLSTLRAEARALVATNPLRAADRYADALRLAPADQDLWLGLAAALMASDPRDWDARRQAREEATAAAINAYRQALSDPQRAMALAVLSETLVAQEFWRPAILALRGALALSEEASWRATYEQLLSEHGFRVIGHDIDANAASPRICVQFSDPLAPDLGQYADYIRVAERADLPVEVESSQLCIDGVEHGSRYRVQVRSGVPAADGERLAQSVELELFVRDRDPMVRFLGRAYVLPKGGEPSIPVVSVNTERIDAEVYRIGDRALAAAVGSGRFRQQLSSWDAEQIANRSGELVWHGTIEIESPMVSRLNRDVTTAVPVGELIEDLRPGIYAMTAQAQNAREPSDTLATQWFLVSDLGLAAFSGNDGLHAIVRSLSSAQPVPNVTLRLIALNDDLLAEVKGGADGVVRFEPGRLRGTGGNAPALLVAEGADGDFGFLDLTQSPFDLSDRGVTGRAPPQPLDVYLVSERGAYRPGESVQLTALVRDARADAVTDLPITFVFKRPDGVEHARVLTADQGLGGYRASLSLSRSAMRGTWRAATYSDPAAPALAEVTFLVEDFVPERISVDLHTADARLNPLDPLEIAVQARYLFGPPAADQPVEGEVQIKPAEGLAAFPGYQFGLNSEPVEALATPFATTRTNATGEAIIQLANPQLPPTTRPLEAAVQVRVSEGSARPVERTLTLPVIPSQARIGVKPLFEEAVEEGGNAVFEVILAGPDDQLQSPAGLRWTLSRLTTRFQWYESDGRWNYEPMVSTQRIAAGHLEDAATDLETTPSRIEARVEWGSYRLRVEREDGTVWPVDLDFQAGWSVAASAVDTPDLIKVVLDRPSYRVGETLRARIEPRFAGIALVMVMDDRLIEMRALPVPEEGATIALPVTSAWGPGAYVTAALYRPMDLAARRMPGRALGITWASIDPGPRQLDLRLAVPPAASGGAHRPRQRLEIPLQVANATSGEPIHVTMAAVDIGILNLTRYQAPAPDRWYFGQRRLGMEIRDLYGQLIDRMQGVPGIVRAGGDRLQLRLEGAPPTEALMAFQSEILRLDADGRGVIGFEVPDFNGTIRLMAMAWSAHGVGHAVSDVVIRDPVVIMASLPPFLAPDDQSRLRLEFTHLDGPAGAMTLSMTGGEEVIEIPPEQREQTLLLDGGGQADVTIPLTARAIGEASLRVALQTPDGQVLTKDLRLSVRANAARVSHSSIVELPPGGTLPLDTEGWSRMVPGTAQLTASITGAEALDVAGLVLRLDGYPYGCTEQLTSRVLPLLYLDEVASLIGLGTPSTIAQQVHEAIGDILLNQSANGSFGLWGLGGDDPWLDAYVTDVLTRAREQGYAVPDTAFTMALDHLRNRLAYVPDFSRGGEEIAYALYVLARNGRAAISDLRYYAESKLDAFATPMAKAQLAAALALYGDRARADRVFAAAVAMLGTDDDDGAWRMDYGSALRDGAAVLTLAAEADASGVVLEDLARRLARHQADLRPTSPQEDAWMLLAAAALMQGAERPRLSIAGVPWEGPWFSRIDEQATAALPVVVANQGQRGLTAVVTHSGIPVTPQPAGGQGYRLERAYYDVNGRRVDPETIVQGDRLVAVLTITAADRRQARLIVDDPLPAGLEIENPHLLRAGEIGDLGWLALEEVAEHLEFRADRFIAAVDRARGAPHRFQLAYRLRAVSPGVFLQPAATVEDMYRPEQRAWTETGRVRVRSPNVTSVDAL